MLSIPGFWFNSPHGPQGGYMPFFSCVASLG